MQPARSRPGRTWLAPGALLKSTAVVPVKPLPVSVIESVTMPEVGARLVTLGAAWRVNVPLAPVPALCSAIRFFTFRAVPV